MRSLREAREPIGPSEIGAGLPVDPQVVLPPGASACETFAAKRGAEREAAIAGLDEAGLDTFERNWSYLARDGQQTPPGKWRTWLIMAGRGFGKTRAGAEWVRGLAESDGRLRIALVAATIAEARAVMVEGESGLLAVSLDGKRPRFERSTNRVLWESGAQAQLFSASEPESLRGPQHHFAWCDELAKWSKAQAAWDNLAFGLRLGERPRTMVTTTPKPLALIKTLLAGEASGRTAVSRGRTADNRAHLAETFVSDITACHGGTRLGRQELDGELIEDLEGALWSRELIERCRAAAAPDGRRRVVIGVDPPASGGPASDACGIVAVMLGADGRGYVIEDASVAQASPEKWARAVATAAARHAADCVVAEANNGGAMVGSVLRAADAGLPIRLVHASHGKSARAEPVMLLYEAGRVSHVGAFRELEDEMAGLLGGGEYVGPGNSPDRADALVWALTELMLGARARRPGVRRL